MTMNKNLIFLSCLMIIQSTYPSDRDEKLMNDYFELTLAESSRILMGADVKTVLTDLSAETITLLSNLFNLWTSNNNAQQIIGHIPEKQIEQDYDNYFDQVKKRINNLAAHNMVSPGINIKDGLLKELQAAKNAYKTAREMIQEMDKDPIFEQVKKSHKVNNIDQAMTDMANAYEKIKDSLTDFK